MDAALQLQADELVARLGSSGRGWLALVVAGEALGDGLNAVDRGVMERVLGYVQCLSA